MFQEITNFLAKFTGTISIVIVTFLIILLILSIYGNNQIKKNNEQIQLIIKYLEGLHK
jgi:preprotein translocase subunit SecG